MNARGIFVALPAVALYRVFPHLPCNSLRSACPCFHVWAGAATCKQSLTNLADLACRYWRGDLTADALLAVSTSVEKDALRLQKERGITRIGLDGTLYDQILDTTFLLGVAPTRFQVSEPNACLCPFHGSACLYSNLTA